MATITFDTHRFVQRLKESGLDEKQAEAITEAFKEAHGEADVATKRDVEQIRGEMATKADVQLLRTELEGKMRLHLVIIIAVIVITNPRALDLIAKILGVAK